MQLQYRNILIHAVLNALPNAQDFQNLLAGVRQGVWNVIVPLNASYANAIPMIVDAAETQQWLTNLLTELRARFPNVTEFATVLAFIEATDTVGTGAADPFHEVLLEGDRPFVNRHSLRNHFQNLTSPAGARLLLVDGEPQTGKSFSYYLLNHGGPRQGFKVNKFVLAQAPTPGELADEILRRLGAETALPAQGTESAERWAERLADIVARAVEASGVPRFFVFDEFPQTPLPLGTSSFIVRLASYSDQELRGVLRIVLVRFPGQLPADLDDVALRDRAQLFSPADMLTVLKQIADARRWGVAEAAVKTKIDEFEAKGPRSLRDRFLFLQGFIRELTSAARARGAPP